MPSLRMRHLLRLMHLFPRILCWSNFSDVAERGGAACSHVLGQVGLCGPVYMGKQAGLTGPSTASGMRRTGMVAEKRIVSWARLEDGWAGCGGCDLVDKEIVSLLIKKGFRVQI